MILKAVNYKNLLKSYFFSFISLIMKNTFTKFWILHHKPPLLLLQQNAVALVFMNAVVAFWETCQNEMKMKKKRNEKNTLYPCLDLLTQICIRKEWWWPSKRGEMQTVQAQCGQTDFEVTYDYFFQKTKSGEFSYKYLFDLTKVF